MIQRSRRRNGELNRALHELRRPLQALVLLEDEDSAPWSSRAAARRGLLELALCGLGELDAAVNGSGEAAATRRFSGRELVLASLERWRPLAGEGKLKLYWDAGAARMEGDPAAVARALDNLLANAIEHGRRPLVVTGARVAGRLRITVANRGGGPTRGATARDGARRGLGIPIVSDVARAHGGRFALYRSAEGCVAALELPLSDAELARAV